MINDYLHFIEWDTDDGFAGSLRLRQYPDIAPVVIDPRFGWGAPVVESARVPVDTVVDLWLAGESFSDVAYEYGLTPEQVEALSRAARAATRSPVSSKWSNVSNDTAKQSTAQSFAEALAHMQ